MIVKYNTCHENHEASAETYNHYACNKRLNVDELKTACDMLATGSSCMKVADFMRTKTKKPITPKDIWNYKSNCQNKLKNKGDKENKDLQDQINLIIDRENQKIFKFVYDEENKEKLLMIYYQNDKMKTLYRLYDEIIFIDGTYNINSYKYPLYLIVIKDCNGNSQIVAWSLVAYERLPLLDLFFKHFTEDNIVNSNSSIVIDKDLTEWNLLSQYMPNSFILYCKFHCVQIFKRTIKNKNLLPILDKFLNCTTETEYKNAQVLLNENIDNRDQKYLDDNWFKNVSKSYVH